MRHSRDFQRRIDAAIEAGWKIEQESPYRVVIKRSNFGERWIHVLIAIFTVGLGNIPYAIYSYLENTERRVLREEIDLDELKLQYARGELTDDEFDRRVDYVLNVQGSQRMNGEYEHSKNR